MSREVNEGFHRSEIQSDIVVISFGEEEQSGELAFTPTKRPPSECSRYVSSDHVDKLSLRILLFFIVMKRIYRLFQVAKNG